MNFIGIEIGGTKLQLAAGDASGRIGGRRRLAVAPEHGGEGIRARIAAELPGLIAEHRPLGIGVGFGGPVDHDTGVIRCSHQVAGWHDFPLGDWLRELSRLPVAVDNDANVAALGEAHHGAGRGRRHVCWVNMGSGVGGGMVVDGRILHGAKPGEMEIGHLRLDRAGGVVEERCSGWAVDRCIRGRVAAADTGAGVLARAVRAQPSPGGEARHLAPALAAGDGLAGEILDALSDDLGFALSHVVHLLHPDVIVVGGGLSLVGEPLRASIARALGRYVMAAFRPGPVVALAGLGEDSVPLGACVLAADACRKSAT